MLPLIAFIGFCSAVCANETVPLKTYYFKMDKPRNELRIHNRISLLNYNLSDFEYSKKPENLKVLQVQENKDQKLRSFFLDSEWNYNHITLNKTELPQFLHRYYEKTTSLYSKSNTTTTRILFNTNANTSSNIIHFNLNSLNPNETVIDADLYFYWPLSNESEAYKASVVLRLYQVELGNDTLESTSISNPDVHKLFNVIYISKAQRGWQSFKMTKIMQNWENGEENNGLLLTISSYTENKLLSIFNDSNIGPYRTFVLIKTKFNNTKEENSSEENIAMALVNLKSYHYNSITDYSSSCQRKQWYIDFQRLHWNDFIISPAGFTAYDCSGKCLKNQESHINHIKLIDIFRQRQSYCVPIEYLPLPIMFYDEFGNVVIKFYDKMIATHCGCR